MTMHLVHVLSVGIGGAAGGLARFWLTQFVDHHADETFPWGTLCVNATGALLVGLLAGAFLTPAGEPAATVWTLLAIGVLGSYTTVSSFSLQTLALIRGNEPRAALANILATLVGCLGLVALGYALGDWLTAA